ncbi:MAG: putative bicarbonate transporter, IctB family, partial [Gemmatimonadaceae bacterium]|nr:putative bicarbonate transporter, IctB family [Gloeobacterales cyanobacterium ES-bin-141]
MTTLPKNWFSSSLLWNWLQRLALKDVPLQVWWERSFPARLQHALENWGATSLVGRLAEPLGLLVLCLVLAVSPFVSTTTVGILLVAALGAWVLLVLKPRFCPAVALPVLAFWLAGSVSLASSQWFTTSLDGWLKLTLYVAGFALGAHLLQRAAYRTAAIATYLLVSLPVSGYGLWQWVYGAQALATWVDQDST